MAAQEREQGGVEYAIVRDEGHDVTQVLFQRFRIMLEVASRFAIQFFHMLYAQLLNVL